MRDWGFWGWFSYGTTFAAAIIIAVIQGGKDMTPHNWLPALFASTRWNYVPLILMLAGGSVFVLREFGWLGKTQTSRSYFPKFGVLWDKQGNPHCSNCKILLSGSSAANNLLHCPSCKEDFNLRDGDKFYPLDKARAAIRREFS
jgi:hypothetical protein